METREQKAIGRNQKAESGTRHAEVDSWRLSAYCLLLTAFSVLAFSSRAHAEGMKIGYVNVGEVFDGYERTKSVDATLEKRGKQKEAELEGRVGELKKLRENLELLNDQAREAKAKEIEEKTDQLQQFRNATARDLRRERDTVAKEILKEIQQVINDYAKANGFSVILDSRSLLFGQPGYDVTDDILKRLNTRPAAKAS